MRHDTQRERVRHWTPLWMAVLLALAAMTISSGPASAHAYLESSDPAEGTHLSAIPNRVRLTFGDDVEAQFTTVTLAIGSDAPATLATTTKDHTVTVPVPASVDWQPSDSTAPWKITYRTVATDGHPVVGTVSFTVTASLPAATAETPSPEALTPDPSAPAAGDGRRPVSAEPAEPFAWFAVVLLSAGTAALAAILWLLAHRARRFKRS